MLGQASTGDICYTNEFNVLAKIFRDSIQKKKKRKRIDLEKPNFWFKIWKHLVPTLSINIIKGDKAPAYSTPTVTAPAQ
jgi:hypothetical protein